MNCKNLVAEVYNAALIGVRSDLQGQPMTLLDWLKVLINTLDGANPLVAQAMNTNAFDELVDEVEKIVEETIVPNFIGSSNTLMGKVSAFVEKNLFSKGFVHLVEPIMLGHKAKIEAKQAAQPVVTESKCPIPAETSKPIVSEQKS